MPNAQQLADAATRIGASPAYFAACLMLLAFGLAYSWFGTASARLKTILFLVLLIGSGTLFVVFYIPPKPVADPAHIDRGAFIVDFQYTGMSADAAKQLEAELQSKGWTIFGVEAASFTPSIIKYGASSNRTAAEALKSDVDALGANLASARFTVDPTIKPTHIELWVGKR